MGAAAEAVTQKEDAMTLIEAVQAALRRGHYSSRTEEAYVHWIRAFVRFHHRRHPREMGAQEITAFLNELALVRRTSASTQNQALCALVFLYRRVLQIEMPELFGLHRARRPVHLPAVLGRRDVQALLDKLKPPFLLMGEMFYGSGLRLMECVSLRIKDVDLDRHQVLVRAGKGHKDRAALLPVRAREPLRAQIAHTAERHRRELASRPCIDPATGRMVLHHIHETAVQKAVQQAARHAVEGRSAW